MWKISIFCKNSTFTQSNSVRVRFFSSVFSFCRIKRYSLWKCKFYRLYIQNPASGLLQIGHKMEDNDVTICGHDVIMKLFWCCVVSPVKFSFWSKFHGSIITGSGVMAIFFYKGLTRNPEIKNTFVWVLPNIYRLGQVRDTKFGMNIFNQMLLNAAKYQV